MFLVMVKQDAGLISLQPCPLPSFIYSTEYSRPDIPVFIFYQIDASREGQHVFMCPAGKLSLWHPLDGVAP